MSTYFNKFILASQNEDGSVILRPFHNGQCVGDFTATMKVAKELYLSLQRVLDNYEEQHGKVMPGMQILSQLGLAPEDV